MRILAALLAAHLAFLAPDCAAAPFGVQIGNTRLVMDTPPGFTNTIDIASPRLQDLAATLTASSNRVLVFGLTDEDYRKFTLGDPAEFRRYLIAVTSRGAESENLSTEVFGKMTEESLRGLGEIVKPPDLIVFLETQPIGRKHLLAELRKESTVVSVMQTARLPPLPGRRFFDSSTPQYEITSETLMLVRGKALRFSIFSLYSSPADADWLRATTERWIDELRRLNR